MGNSRCKKSSSSCFSRANVCPNFAHLFRKLWNKGLTNFISRAVDEAPDLPNATPFEDLEKENKGLHARIQHLEVLLLKQKLESPETPFAALCPATSSRSSLPQDDILHSFQNLHVDTPRSPHTLRASVGESGEELLMLLPIRKSSEKIVRFSLEALGWIHCALNAPDFLDQHEMFWDTLYPQHLDSLEDHSWMALYLSVLCVSCIAFPPRRH